MSLLDRFRRHPKPDTAGEAVGGTGRQHTSGFLDWDERNWQLRGRRWYDEADKMWRTDGDVRRALQTALVPIVSGTWTVDPPGDEDDPASEQELWFTRLVEFALFSPEGMSPQLPGHLWQAGYGAGRWGSAPFEKVWKLAEFEGRTVIIPDTLDVRRPRAVEEWLQDGHRLTGIAQWNPGKGRAENGRVEIPREDLVYYRLGAEGDNWEGEALIRPAYKHWFMKQGLEVLQAKQLDRLRGIPTGYPPANSASEEQLDEFEEFLSKVGGDDAGYYLAPGPHQEWAEKGQGWLWEYVVPPDAKDVIEAFTGAQNYHADKIAASVLEEFMRQGMSRVGTNATAETQQNPFLMLCEAIANTVFEPPLNQDLVPHLAALNAPDGIRMPRVSCSLIDPTTLEELGSYVQQLAGAGALRPEPRLEAYLRQRADLPPADEDAIAEAEEQQRQLEEERFERAQAAHAGAAGDDDPDGGGAEEKRASTATRTLRRADRDLKPHEQHMSLDRLEHAVDTARDQFIVAAGPAVRVLAAELAQTIAAGRDIKPATAPVELAQALEQVLGDLYDQGRVSVREELESQGWQDPTRARPGPYALAADPVERARRFGQRARAAAQAVRDAMVAALNRRRTRAADLADLTVVAEEAARGAIREEAYAHAASVVNAGRSDQADELGDVIAGARYTSILDANRCSACARADDDVLRPLSDPVRLARKPPNPLCEGGWRCRCMEAFQLAREDAPAV